MTTGKRNAAATRESTFEAFVRAWQESESAAEAGRKVGLSASAASSRASIYRRRGIHLKHMPGRARGQKQTLTPSVIDELNRRYCNGNGDAHNDKTKH